MRPIFLSFAIIALFGQASAQVSIGATAQTGRYYHYNYNDWNYKSPEPHQAALRADHSDGINNYQAGGFVYFQLTPRLSLQTEVLYGKQKQLFEISWIDTDAYIEKYLKIEYYTSNSYFKIPNLLKWTIPVDKNQRHGFYLETGLTLGILKNYKEVKDIVAVNTVGTKIRDYVEFIPGAWVHRVSWDDDDHIQISGYCEIYSKATLSANVGLGWQSIFKNGFMFWLGTRAECGLTNLENFYPKNRNSASFYNPFGGGVRGGFSVEGGIANRKITRGIFINASVGLGYRFGKQSFLPVRTKKQDKELKEGRRATQPSATDGGR